VTDVAHAIVRADAWLSRGKGVDRGGAAPSAPNPKQRRDTLQSKRAPETVRHAVVLFDLAELILRRP
jgi:hypothetical protein